jgi:hypothetical protein
MAAQSAESDLIVLDNFDDNLTCESGLRTVRDPALAALLAGSPAGRAGRQQSLPGPHQPARCRDRVYLATLIVGHAR